MIDDRSLTQQLHVFFGGDHSAVDALLQEILPKLREIAVRELSRERYIAPVSATELIHEIWLRNISKASWQIRDQGHFYAIASLAMRRVLIDAARRRLSEERIQANGDGNGATADAQQIIEIGILMERLEDEDSDAARVVDMHYFGGFTFTEIAASTKLTVRQVRTRWARGLKWLKTNLKSDGPDFESRF